jgi:hypothetical protein
LNIYIYMDNIIENRKIHYLSIVSNFLHQQKIKKLWKTYKYTGLASINKDN